MRLLQELYKQWDNEEERESRRCIPVEIFVSWSGAMSREVAELLRDWLRKTLQSLKVWVSTEDIETGAMWFAKICEQIKKVNNSTNKRGGICRRSDEASEDDINDVPVEVVEGIKTSV